MAFKKSFKSGIIQVFLTEHVFKYMKRNIACKAQNFG